jgi:F420-non-reducing hydrogenase small subunit
MMKTRISTEWLSGCSGCHVAVVDLHEKLLNLVEDVEFVRIPVLIDEKGYPEADVGIVEGAIRSEHDRHALLKMRESCKKLIAFGTCAVYGGPSGIGWLYDKDAILKKVYSETVTSAADGKLPMGAPELEQSVIPINEVVDIDFYIPGCPPHPYFIALAIKTLLGADVPDISIKTVCSACNRKMEKREGVKLQKGMSNASEEDICLLSQGVVCLGSVTLDRCQAQCPNKGVACAGCAGPSIDIITEPHLDIRTLIAKRMSMLTGIDQEEILHYIEDEAKTFYSYCLSSPSIYKKPTVEMREWTAK